ncbi:MAG: type II secretion system GspH family protein [Rhodospirillales bacterium]|nr:type II secretion system GspH family protein [Rhodospirillales bacterium]
MLRQSRPGFTLVEILIVVVILGILAAIIIPQFANATQATKQSAFISDLNTFTRAISHYTAINDPPADGSSGTLPAELEPFINKDKFEAGTPLGGVWDTEFNDNGVGSAVGVHFNDGSNPGDAYMTEIDLMADNGNLTSGGFRKLADDRFYNVLR